MPIKGARYYRTLLICPNAQFLADLRPLLAEGLPQAAVQEVVSYPSRRQLTELLRGFDAKLCFLDISVEGAEPARVLEELQAVSPGLPVFGLLASNNPDAMPHYIRQGIADFLIVPFTADQMEAAIGRIARMIPPPARGATSGKTVAIMPAKGAAGGTTIACNLAYQCKRMRSKRILLADMDPLAGTVSFLLKLDAGYSFMDVLARSGSLDADLWKQMITRANGIDVLLAPEIRPDPTDLQSATPILEHAQEAYDVRIVDCGSAFGAWNVSIAKHCDELLLVSTNELASLLAVQRALAYFEANRVEAGKVRFVVNRYVKDAGLNDGALAEVFGPEVLQVIPNEPETVQNSLMEGKPIPAKSAVGKGLAALAERLFPIESGALRAGRQISARAGLPGIFSR